MQALSTADAFVKGWATRLLRLQNSSPKIYPRRRMVKAAMPIAQDEAVDGGHWTAVLGGFEAVWPWGKSRLGILFALTRFSVSEKTMPNLHD